MVIISIEIEEPFLEISLGLSHVSIWVKGFPGIASCVIVAMGIPITQAQPTELELTMSAENPAVWQFVSSGKPEILYKERTHLHPPFFSMLFLHLGHERVFALIH